MTTPHEQRLELERSIASAPLPITRALRRRRNPVVQLVKFISLNSRMGYLALRKHR